MNTKNTYSISQLTRHFAVTPRTLRFYEDKGLLSPRRVENRRIYHERDFVRLKLILRGRRIGFSLAEIQQTLELYDTQSGDTQSGVSAQIEFVLKTLAKHRAKLQQRHQDIAATLDDMRDIEQRLRAGGSQKSATMRAASKSS